MAEKDLYLWAENTTYNSGAVTVIKYKTGTSRNLAGVCFKISVVSGNFPAVEDSGSTYQLSDCVDQAKQGTNFSGAAADIYSADGNKWVLCSGNSSKNIITLAGTVGLTSSDTGTNVLAYLYGGEYTIVSILSASDSSAQSYTTKGWTSQVGNPNPNNAPTEITFTEVEGLTAGHIGKVGTLATTDADVGDTHTYTLTTTGGAAHASLEIGGASSDEVHVKSSATIAEQDYTFKITTNDGNGGTFSKDFTVTFSAAGGGDVTQTITVPPESWDWISFYVEITELADIVVESGSSDLDIIKTKNYFATHYGEYNVGYGWFPADISADLNIGQMFQYKNLSTEEKVLKVTGSVPSSLDLVIVGPEVWSWVGFCNLDGDEDIAQVFSGSGFAANTLIKKLKSYVQGEETFTTYYENFGWFPSTFKLRNGEGYQIKNMGSDITINL